MASDLISDRSPKFAAGLAETQAALTCAERLHEGQVRAADGALFIVQPIELGTRPRTTSMRGSDAGSATSCAP